MSERFAERFFHFLLPLPCLGCQRPLRREDRSGPGESGSHFGLCRSCRVRLRPAPAATCPSCGAAAAGATAACPICRSAPRSYRRLLWGWNYAPPFDRVIAGLKFRRLDYLADQLGGSLARRFAGELGEEVVVTPVPLGRWRRLRRGFDQAEALATVVARESDKKLVSLLERQRSTPPQSLAGFEARRANLQGAFRVRPVAAAPWRGCHIVLVDDVVTTGATLEAAASALLEAGIPSVTALVAGRTAAPGER